MKSVNSSNIDSIGYNATKKQLFVKFKNDTIYVYKDVPKDVWNELQNVESKGKFVYYEIKDVYDYEKL